MTDDPQGHKAWHQGTHRWVSPAQTVERFAPLQPVMGITRLANLTGLDRVGLPVVMAYRPNARSLAVSSGKGLTLPAAMASGLMEAIEVWHAERVPLPLRLASYNELRYGERVIDVHRLPHLSVRGPFDPSRQLLWVQGEALRDHAPVWVPFELVHTNFTLPLPTGSGQFVMSSNGLASGNHVLEATTHGLFEVIERDASTLYQLGRRRGRAFPKLDLSTVDDPGCREALDRFAAADVAVGVWEATSDVGLPVFYCVLVDAPHPVRPAYATSGVGCHPDGAVALLRALTEAAQGRVIYIAGARDDRDRETYERARDPDFTARVRARVLGDDDPLKPFAQVARLATPTFKGDLDLTLDRLAAVGLEEAVVVDLTREPFNVPVVRTIVPGLEAMQELEGYAPGARALAALEAP